MAIPAVIRNLAAAVTACAIMQTALAQPAKDIERTGGPYVPTPQVVVDHMLRFGNVSASDYLIDLGSGDGVIVRTAAVQMKASGIGIEIDPELVKRANDEARKQGVADRASFQVMDVFKADLSKASVVTLYLLPGMMMNLRSKIFNELRGGARVVSHDYHFGDWAADDRITFDVPEKEFINGVPSATVYLWIVPAKIGGRWQIRVDSPAQGHEVEFSQNFQVANGTLINTRGAGISDVAVKGEDITFSIWSGAVRHHYRGKVKGNAMGGTVNLDGREAKWQAVRAATK